ncbi:MAG TPA: tetratricopeptide repeat protein [Candidatus Eisenbacteria bacterium]|nr:tetratricopeptide repeat protein [Candidatus Eisenbacteria bacterium]
MPRITHPIKTTLPTLDDARIFPLPGDPEPAPAEARPEAGYRSLLRERRTRDVILDQLPPHRALEELQQILSGTADPEVRAWCYLRAGQLRERAGSLAAAQSHYEEAVALEPEDPEVAYFAWNNVAYCLNRAGRNHEAEPAARRARDLDPKRWNAHKNLGVALEGLGRNVEAAESHLAAAKMAPEHPVPLRRLRMLLARDAAIAREHPGLAQDVERLVHNTWGDRRPSAPPDSDILERELRDRLGRIEVDEAVVHGDFQIFGLRWMVAQPLAYRTLDEALSARALQITEVSEQGSVPRIRVRNAGTDRIFLMAGEQFVGAKQNRVLNASILVDAHADLQLPVSCVEQGRWAYRDVRFTSKGSSHYALRHLMSKKAHAHYKVSGTPDSDQREVWREVARKLGDHDTASPSGALDDVYTKLGRNLDQAVEPIQSGEDWCGAAFAFGGRIVGVDLFDKPATLRLLWPKLTRAYALDVMGKTRVSDLSKTWVESWIHDAAHSLIDFFPSPGAGIDCRFESNHHAGAVLIVDGCPVHLEMFHEEEM